MLKEELVKIGNYDTEKAIERFDKYREMLVSYNEVMNLTAITEKEEVEIKHFIDSISPLGLDIVKNGAKVIDVGSGAGFPGLPMKIAREDIDITLMDSLTKRVNFLNEVIDSLELSGAKAVHFRAEDMGQDENYRESFDVAVSRAVAPLSVLAEYCLPLVKVGGAFLALKGPKVDEEAKSGENAIECLGGKLEKVFGVNLPGGITHYIAYVKKISQTPSKYPRKAGKPTKKPL